MERSKLCASCGLPFAWRRKWAKCWGEVRYCSERCRRARRAIDRELEVAILALLDAREGTSICPSEAARRVRPDDWRPLMERTRWAARRLCHRGAIRILKRGVAIDPAEIRGPIRLAKL
ncbi:MAG: DUF3253 domain-containing protein [Myxococcota bacterium]